jgi:hypothetical protein
MVISTISQDYLSVEKVLEDDVREKRMRLLYIPENPIQLSLDVLRDQFESNQAAYLPPELITHWKDIIIGKTNKK